MTMWFYSWGSQFSEGGTTGKSIEVVFPYVSCSVTEGCAHSSPQDGFHVS